ncbi:toll/interleukin-1 receptor domain-containing protein [Micromonospora sp. NPDC053740]|uniref:toll/interleukin-1 receptor domain-containing protein n=1 Tax=Micromonospora sp. NPDC053740 TaxID=3155173 RepID=UPI003439B8EC
MSGIFINYRTVDSALGAVMLDNKLVERFGRDLVFRDDRSLPMGKAFEQILWDRLQTSDVVLAVIGPHWLTEAVDGLQLIADSNDFVHREIAKALDLNLNLVPVLVGDTPLPKPQELPQELRRLPEYKAFSIRARNPEPDINRLVDQLAELPAFASLAPPESSPQRPTPAGESQAVHNHVNTVRGENIVFGFQNRG